MRDSVSYPAMLQDRFGRKVTNLRISVTDRCNLRCNYCLPKGFTNWMPAKDFLSVAEIARLSRLSLEMGITEVRITGGEPLLRPDLSEIIHAIHQEFTNLNLNPHISLTTNAIGLDARLDELIQAGLKRVNVSLDTLDSKRFTKLTSRDCLHSVLDSLAALSDSPLHPIKINTVMLDQVSLKEIPALVHFALDHGFEWRAIEFMPLGPLSTQSNSSPKLEQITEKLRVFYDLSDDTSENPYAPAKTWLVTSKNTTIGTKNLSGRIGIIASNSNPFCANCTRIRLSANGRIYSCLFTPTYTDLLPSLRNGESDALIKQLWKNAILEKPAGRNTTLPLPKQWRMSQIGG